MIAARNAVPRVRAYQATPWTHPVSAPRGVVVQPSSRTAAPGATAAKSSLGQPGVPGSVARAKANRSDFQREPKIYHLVPRRRVLAVRSPRKSWKIQVEDRFSIARITVEDSPTRAQFARPDAHQFSPERVAR